mmetsp:Transcript_143187/g.252734  ORF Transcript_143187/g.252734 Transcript_143187/m.252734 type:complete len:212 (+) Transcript_143187:63-698(+)
MSLICLLAGVRLAFVSGVCSGDTARIFQQSSPDTLCTRNADMEVCNQVFLLQASLGLKKRSWNISADSSNSTRLQQIAPNGSHRSQAGSTSNSGNLLQSKGPRVDHAAKHARHRADHEAVLRHQADHEILFQYEANRSHDKGGHAGRSQDKTFRESEGGIFDEVGGCLHRWGIPLLRDRIFGAIAFFFHFLFATICLCCPDEQSRRRWFQS